MTMKNNMSVEHPTYGRIGSRVSRALFKVWTVTATLLLLRMSLMNNSIVTREDVHLQTSALLDQKLEALFQQKLAAGQANGDSSSSNSSSGGSDQLKWDAVLERRDNSVVVVGDAKEQQQSGMTGNKAFEVESLNSKIDFEQLVRLKQEAKQRYSERKHYIRQYCDKHLNYNPLFKKANTKFNYWEKQMWFSQHYKFSWCPVPKAGSTTWTEHMSILTGKRWQDIMEELSDEGVPRVDHRNVFKSKYYGLPVGAKVEEFANKEVFTWIFVRHPFSRIVSAYSEKMDKDWVHTENKAMKDVRDKILTKYRNMQITE